ncbi:MAG: hypothetical protein EXS36_02940 [Pedosphaera sp.]|nr:hypothetical protein [Pedosphaera sp.]
MARELEKRHGKTVHKLPTGAYEDPGFDDKSRWVILGAAAATILAVVALVYAKPIYVHLRTARGLRFAQESEAFLARGEMHQSGNRIQASLKLASLEPAVWRAAAHFCATNYMRGGLNYYTMLLRSSAATRDDRLGYAHLALDLNLTDLPGPVLDELIRVDPLDSDALRLRVSQLNLTGRATDAISTARVWLGSKPDSPDAQCALGVLLLYEKDATNRSEGRRMLWTQAMGDGPMHFRAAELLGPNQELTRDENEGLIRSLLGRPKPSYAERLAAASIRIKIDPQHRASEIQEMMPKSSEAVPNDELAALVNWMVDQGEAVRALELLPAERARDHPELLAARLRAQGSAGLWGDVSTMLERDEKAKVLEPYLFHLYSVAVEIAKGNTEENAGRDVILGHFQNALAACGNRVAPIQFVAQYAEHLGQYRAAISSYSRLMDYPPLLISSGKAILRLVEPLDDINIQRQTLRRLVSFVPTESLFQLQNAYLACLSNNEVAKAKAYLEKYLTTNPRDGFARATIALALLRLGQSAAALEMIENSGLNWAAVQPRWTAIHAAILGATEDRSGARMLARKLENAPLRGEERRLIEPWL